MPEIFSPSSRLGTSRQHLRDIVQTYLAPGLAYRNLKAIAADSIPHQPCKAYQRLQSYFS